MLGGDYSQMSFLIVDERFLFPDMRICPEGFFVAWNQNFKSQIKDFELQIGKLRIILIPIIIIIIIMITLCIHTYYVYTHI